MPCYRIACACGADETWTPRPTDALTVECEDCGATTPKIISAPNLRYSTFSTPGPGASGGYSHAQQEGEFATREAFEQKLASEGKRAVSMDSFEGKRLRERIEGNAAKTAAGFGYSDAGEFQAKARTREHMHGEFESNIPRLTKPTGSPA